jgi:hypothetical protein
MQYFQILFGVACTERKYCFIVRYGESGAKLKNRARTDRTSLSHLPRLNSTLTTTYFTPPSLSLFLSNDHCWIHSLLALNSKFVLKCGRTEKLNKKSLQVDQQSLFEVSYTRGSQFMKKNHNSAKVSYQKRKKIGRFTKIYLSFS